MENSIKNPMYYYSTIKAGKNLKKIRRVAFVGIINNNILSIGSSVCSEKDQFDKHKGKAIALGRALKNPVLTLNLVSITEPYGKIFVQQCKKLSENNKVLPIRYYEKKKIK